jgi:phosphatidate cytidylyltransferase
VLKWRLASAAVIVTTLVLLIVLDYRLGGGDGGRRPGMVLAVVAFAVAILSSYELFQLHAHEFTQPFRFVYSFIAGIGVALNCLPIIVPQWTGSICMLGWTVMAWTLVVGAAVAVEIICYDEDGQGSRRLSWAALCYSLILLLFGNLIAHRLLFGDNRMGVISLVTLITTVKMSDAAAYFAGTRWGKHKLAPRLSPGKTWEGLAGSFVGSLVGAVIVIYCVKPLVFKGEPNISLVWVISYSIVLTLAGVLGDLAESLLKRDAHIKDSSSLVPGLGGVLDILDSLIFAAPVSYFLWLLVK